MVRTISAQIEPELLDRIRGVAESEDRSVGRVIRQALRWYVDRDGAE